MEGDHKVARNPGKGTINKSVPLVMSQSLDLSSCVSAHTLIKAVEEVLSLENFLPHVLPTYFAPSPLQLFHQRTLFPFLPLLSLAHTGSDTWQGQSNQAPTVRLNTLRENGRVSSSLEPTTASWLYSPCEFITVRPLVATREDFRCLCRTKIRKWKSNLWDKHLSHCSACQIFRVREALRDSRYHFEPKKLSSTSLPVIPHCCPFTIYFRSHLVFVFSVFFLLVLFSVTDNSDPVW